MAEQKVISIQDISVRQSSLVRALSGERPERTPVWFMRQAGRFLSEYRALREKHSMLELIRTPELAAEVTLQPMRRFELDGAIIFADILNPLIGMGVDLEFQEGIGPVIGNPINSAAAVDRLRVPHVHENSGYTLEAISIVALELSSRGLPVLGFAGAPFTLSAYLIEGRGSQRYEKVKAFMYAEPDAWDSLQRKLVQLVSDYLIAQAHAGAAAVQLFDSWLGALSPGAYEQFVAPYLTEIIRRVKSETSVPVVFFATGIAGLYPRIGQLPADVFGIDWRVTLPEAAALLGRSCPLQGNIDPLVLATAPRTYLDREVQRILAEGKTLPAHIFNVGHGIIPSTPVDSVKAVIEMVHACEAI